MGITPLFIALAGYKRLCNYQQPMRGTAPVKYFVSLIASDVDLRDHAIHLLADELGEADFTSDWFPFTHTSYYAAEMGEELKRSFISFKDLLPPEDLPRLKRITAEAEHQFMEDGKRKINIDPGYIDFFKIVLASGKFGPHRVALKKGCYADFIMYYDGGLWKPLPWSFPDFADGNYNNALLEIRKLFKIARRVK